MSTSKTEKATPKKRQDARKKGNVVVSKDIVSAATIITSFYSLKIIMQYAFNVIQEFTVDINNQMSSISDMNITIAREVLISTFIVILKIMGPLFLVIILVSVIGTIAQTKGLFTTEKLKFKLENISPMKGFKRMFSINSLFELGKNLIKITILALIVYSHIKKEFSIFPDLMFHELSHGVNKVFNSIIDLVISVTIAFIAISVMDYVFKWFEYEKNLRMSKQEVKDEYKEQEGDPQLKAKLRERQRRFAQARMMQAVPEADVIIKNPTHYAIAIKYDREKHRAPMVIAKGIDALALRIIKIAEENNVVTIENRPLARALYDTVEINNEILFEQYNAVAEILVTVYNLKEDG